MIHEVRGVIRRERVKLIKGEDNYMGDKELRCKRNIVII